MDSAIAETQKVVNFVSQNEAMLHAYHMQQMAIMDEASRLHEAREERDIEHAKNALKEGISVEVIKKITGLPLDTVIKLKL
jgi:hypothetical protein